MTKVFIATPAFDGKTHVPYTLAFSDTVLLLASHNIPVVSRINCSGSLLVAERNRLIKAFLGTDCTHMLMIDSDLGWPAQAVLAMLKHDLDVVSGVYPSRHDKGVFIPCRPCLNEDGSLVIHKEKPVLKMDYIPSGFVLIKRIVLERMVADNSHLYYEPKSKEMKHENGYLLFNTELFEGEFWGEDFVFCRNLRKSGFEIWVDPAIQFNHAGNIGAFQEILAKKKEEEKPVEE